MKSVYSAVRTGPLNEASALRLLKVKQTSNKKVYPVVCIISALSSIKAMKQNSTRQDSQCMYNVTFRRFRATTGAVEKQLLHILGASEAVGIQHAMRMCYSVICGLSGLCFGFVNNFCLKHFSF
jgi:hypothetical protein